jgi:hypothetical protein
VGIHMRLCIVPLLADRISRWEDAVISRAGFSNQAFSLAGRRASEHII